MDYLTRVTNVSNIRGHRMAVDSFGNKGAFAGTDAACVGPCACACFEWVAGSNCNVGVA